MVVVVAVVVDVAGGGGGVAVVVVVVVVGGVLLRMLCKAWPAAMTAVVDVAVAVIAVVVTPTCY